MSPLDLAAAESGDSAALVSFADVTLDSILKNKHVRAALSLATVGVWCMFPLLHVRACSDLRVTRNSTRPVHRVRCTA